MPLLPGRARLDRQERVDRTVDGAAVAVFAPQRLVAAEREARSAERVPLQSGPPPGPPRRAAGAVLVLELVQRVALAAPQVRRQVDVDGRVRGDVLTGLRSSAAARPAGHAQVEPQALGRAQGAARSPGQVEAVRRALGAARAAAQPPEGGVDAAVAVRPGRPIDGARRRGARESTVRVVVLVAAGGCLAAAARGRAEPARARTTCW